MENREKETWQYRLLRFLAVIVFHTIYPLKYHNKERLKNLQTPCIVIGNHKHFLDPIAVAFQIKNKPVYYFAKKELFENKIVASFLKNAYGIPVSRKKSDMQAMRTALKVLKQGNILGIFPEGTRHKEGVMKDVESGTSLIALRSKVPVIPIYIKGKISAFKMNHVYVGEPIDYNDILAKGVNKTTCDEFTARLTQVYENMIEKAKKLN